MADLTYPREQLNDMEARQRIEELRREKAQKTLHAALRVLSDPQLASAADERSVRHYALDGESPLEEVAASIVHGLMSELLVTPGPYTSRRALQ